MGCKQVLAPHRRWRPIWAFQPSICGIMTPTEINARDFPDSAYALELQRSPAGLRFEPTLESEYSIAHLQRVRRRVRIWFTLTFLVRVLLALDQVRHTGILSAPALIYTGGILPCGLALLWLSWGRNYQRLYLRAAPVLVPLFYTLVAVEVARALAIGRFEQFAGFAVVLIAVSSLAGLKFREALLTVIILLIAFPAAGIAVGLAPAVLLKCMVVLVITGIIAAVVCWDVEKSSRETFLERALIGELLARDSLTGLKNRRSFDDHLQRVWQQALRDRCPIAVCMIDVDHFKRYNDALGHQAGDVALRGVAKLIQEFARRPLDLAARYGGEEFALILYDLSPVGAQSIAERLLNRVRTERFGQGAAASTLELKLTISIGVAQVPPVAGRTPQGAVQLADEALYEAKRAGRNRIVVSGAEEYRELRTGSFKATPLSQSPR
jgi:diguanylate cyclase (GGDEF)-like protein